MRTFTVVYPDCESKAIISKTNRNHKMLADVYCTCSNPECGHRFVANVTFSHTLCPSALTDGQMIQSLLKGITPEQRADTIGWLKAAQDKETQEAKDRVLDPTKPVVTRRKHADYAAKQ
ncbi:ogr/Delta-like zinc finger family protein [Serratia marcescens]|uniref:ogr/Delta-like zinc finger family protein n=1 Tax=Serratia marcescens TaxID=615 RepID=UPI000F7EFCD9|nr:ogr/Delta-like zinc finger family protein [Serratia marcescens]RTF40771.1 transcriptional regulator [Serratia marcescens]